MSFSYVQDRCFSVEQTHGILSRSEHKILARSDELGWASVYASLQHEVPYEGHYAAIDDHFLVLHLSGPVGVRRWLDGTEERRLVPPGGLFILPGGADFGVRLEGELDSLHIYLRREMVQEVAEDLGFGDGPVDLKPSLGEPDPLAEWLALGLRDALTSQDSAAQAYAEYLSRALAAHLVRVHSTTPVAGVQRQGGLTGMQLRQLTDFIESNLDKSLSLAQMAAACGLSPTHFSRRFKVSVGEPPHRWLMQQRVARAKRLLQGPMRIVDIALACGFAHQEHLTSVFRRFAGLTPASFRRTVWAQR